ncbi:pheromone-binding protein 1-like [Battus philenor]|uniref:pheromone-binding protein 1-like n=1 Tax=Battus philenor TaxID=42288 RepID=UPI0035D06348
MRAAGVLLLLTCCAGFERPQRVVNDVCTKIAVVMTQCTKEKHPEYEIYPNLARFWNPKRVISDWKWGCMFLCAAWKLKLLHGKNRLNEENLDRLLLANGADAHTVSALVDVFRLCKRRWLRNANSCDLWARVTGCIRDAIIGYGWMPDY